MSEGARGVIAAADTITGKIVEAEKMRAALEEIKRLHSARIMPDGQMWCDICCFDQSGHQTEDCAQSHEHRIEWTSACSTAEIIGRAGL